MKKTVVIVVVVAIAAYALGRLQHMWVPEGDVADGDAVLELAAPAPPGTAPTTAPPPSGHPQAPRDLVANQNFVHFRVGRSNVKAMLVDGPLTWIGTTNGVIRYSSGTDRHTIYNNQNGLLSNGVFYLGKNDGEIWVGTYGGGLSILEPESEAWRNYNIPNGMGDAFVYDVLRTRTGDIWIATWSGANRVVGGRLDNFDDWTLYTVENTNGGLPNDWVYGLAEGKDGEVWMATEGGLARFSDGQWDNWNHESGLGAPYELVEADIEYKSDPGQVSAHHARQKVEMGLEGVSIAYNPNYIVSLQVDQEGHVWAGTWGGGLSRFDGTRWRTFTVHDGLSGNHVFALAQDTSGNIWAGTNRGLSRYDGEAFTNYGVEDGLISAAIFSIAFADNGALWAGSLGGVAWFPLGLSR